MKLSIKIRVAQNAMTCFRILADYRCLLPLRPSSNICLLAGRPGEVGSCFTESIFMPVDDAGVVHERRMLIECVPGQRIVWDVANDTGTGAFVETITIAAITAAVTDITFVAEYAVPMYYWLLYPCIFAGIRPRMTFCSDTLRILLENAPHTTMPHAMADVKQQPPPFEDIKQPLAYTPQ